MAEQVLSTTQVISDVFPTAEVSIKSTFVVRLQGTINGDWDIESALADVAPASRVWESDTGDIGYTSDDKTSAEHLFLPGCVYRVNLGTGNQGPTGTLHETSINSFR